MLPSILAKQLQKGIGDYIETTFPMTNEPFKGSVQKMLATKDSVYHEPYVAVRLPFRVAEEMQPPPKEQLDKKRFSVALLEVNR